MISIIITNHGETFTSLQISKVDLINNFSHAKPDLSNFSTVPATKTKSLADPKLILIEKNKQTNTPACLNPLNHNFFKLKRLSGAKPTIELLFS